jgi:hypothetical protein
MQKFFKYKNRKMVTRQFNYYYVVKGGVIGTHPTRKKIYANKVLYEGTNLKTANQIYRQNSSSNKFDEENPSIYVGVDTTDRIVLHKA